MPKADVPMAHCKWWIIPTADAQGALIIVNLIGD